MAHRHAWRKDGTCRCGEVREPDTYTASSNDALEQVTVTMTAPKRDVMRVRAKTSRTVGSWYEGKYVEIPHEGIDLAPDAAKHFLATYSRDLVKE
jgi:hypothetical protein